MGCGASGFSGGEAAKGFRRQGGRCYQNDWLYIHVSRDVRVAYYSLVMIQ